MSGSAPIAVVAACIQRERHRAGLSLAELARRAKVAKSTLSQLEAGTGNPSLETLWALSVALEVPFARLVEPTPQRIRLVRAGEGPAITSAESSYVATLLGSCAPHARCDLYLVTAQPGTARASEAHMAGVVEHVLVSSGRALVGPMKQTLELAPGDYLAYPADQPHLFEALEPETTATLVQEYD